MAFGGSGGFTFGSNNNQNTGFGGFGSSNNTTGGFVSNTSNTGFGSSTAASNPFGGSAFGSNSNTGGFGSNSSTGSSLFGNKTNTTNLFGSNTSNTGGGLFGSNTNTNTGGGFGSSSGGFGNTSNNAFGSGSSTAFSSGFGSSNKPTFGSNPSSTPLFGQGGAGTTGGFGSTGAFGSGGSGTALGNQPVPPSEGTASVPFAPTNEKEANNNQQNSYQTITFQQPYQKYSLEELRLADYNAGRRFGSGGGQAGAFGASNFGGFGSSNTGGTFGSSTTNNPFGSNTSSSGGFGNNTSTAFGSNTGGGLFGNKPAGGGLFGQQSSGTTSGGLFGSSNNTTSSNPFGGGSSSTFGSNTGGGLFGNNNQNQNKPSLFGNTGTSNTSTGFSFGNNNQSSNTGGGLFGNNNQQQQPSGGLFGNTNNQQQQKTSLFGNSTGGGFGSTGAQGQTSGGLFGSSNNTNAGGSLFGNQTSSNTGGGLFGNTSSNTSGGLFGNQNINTNKPGGLFSGSTFGHNQQQPTGGGLFGNANSNTNQSGGGLFGSSTNQASNAFSFGNNNQNKPAGSMFGNTSTNQGGGLFSNTNNSNSLFGGSMSQPQQSQQQPDGFKHSSLLDPNPYGQSSIWTGLPTPNLENSKPLVTPLVATQKLKESQAKPPPTLRLNQSRYMTPPRRTGTYGFTYSTYGTPNSAASTPGGNGLSNSMYVSRFSGGSFGRSMGKAASVSNLRSQYADGESVLTPGAFAPTASRYSSGSIRRLHIDRSIKSDLFTRPSFPALTGPPTAANGPSTSDATPPAANLEPAPDTSQKLKKRVSFDRDTTGGQTNGELNGESGALVRTEVDDEPAVQDRDQTREVNGASAPPEQPRGNELAVVPEDRESESPIPKKQAAKVIPLANPEMGDYWMKPTRTEINKMPRSQLQHFVGFEVGRHGAGKVRFDDPVDLTTVPLDELFVSIVEIYARSVTVYPDPSTKPPPGKGLNVPSTISIEHSWPRAKGKPTALDNGLLYEKHLKRLKNIRGTEFKSYNPETGVWTFTVSHYTRYGLDYDDDEIEDFGESQLSVPPDSIDQYKTADMSVMEVDSGDDSSRQDDTFSFKQKTVPGGFGRQPVIDDESEDFPVRSIEHDADGSERSAVSEEEISDEDMDMAGSYPEPSGPALDFESPSKPILKPGGFGTPGKPLLDLDGDWAEQLQRTISPRKQNRDALREAQNKILLDRAYEPMKPKSAIQKKDFRTSLDVMNAIFDRPERRTRAGKGKGQGNVQAELDFEFPYAKRAKTFDPNDDDMSGSDRAWHASFKPKFSETNQLVYKTAPVASIDWEWQRDVLVRDDDKVISISGLKPQQQLDIAAALQHASVTVEKGTDVPKIDYATNIPFSVVRASLPPHLASSTELPQLYELLHVLFDAYEDEFSYDLTQQQKEDYEERIRKDRLSQILTKLLANVDNERTANAEKDNPLEAVVRHLARHEVKSACDVLMKTKNFHLSLLLAQIKNSDSGFQEDMKKQIEAWTGQNTISEMNEDVRTLYELLAGNTTMSQGKPSGPVEDRASTFTISQKYGFNWLQAFALSCWYGKVKEGTVGDWVEGFQRKIEIKEETATPVSSSGDEDVMWVVLKLYASMSKGSKMEKPTLPQALGALESKWDASAAFHVFQALKTALSGQGVKIDHDAADNLAATSASQLESRTDVVAAVYALLHLKDPAKRASMIQDLLNRHAATLTLPDSSMQWQETADPENIRTFSLLTRVLKVPLTWIATSKALFARSTHRPSDELRYLILANDYNAAHQCLCRRVAPRLVIDEDYDTLKAAVMKFKDIPTQYIPGWEDGGSVYASFVSVVLADKKKGKDKERRVALERCRKGLESIKRRFEGKAPGEGGLEELEGRVAVQEMGRVLAQIMEDDEGEGKGVESSKAILNLPLTADARMAQARKMGVEYYRRVMATVR